jgi:hypothetical protein
MDETTRAEIEANIFPAARGAIQNWATFPWHRGPDGTYHVAKLHSSQALAIDVFGAIAISPHRDLVLSALAAHLGIPALGPWTVSLEWEDRPANRLREPRPTQVDAVAQGRESLIFFECKFTEADGGECSQTKPLAKGDDRAAGIRRARARQEADQDRRQCNGNYVPQTNPVNQRSGRCALASKGIAYWDVIPKVFRMASDQDYRPCPFAGPWFQWMRNLVLCHDVAAERGLRAVFVVVYADADGLPLAEKAKAGGWTELQTSLRPGGVEFRTVSYQELLREARSAIRRLGESDSAWEALDAWIARKTREAPRQARATP